MSTNPYDPNFNALEVRKGSNVASKSSQSKGKYVLGAFGLFNFAFTGVCLVFIIQAKMQLSNLQGAVSDSSATDKHDTAEGLKGDNGERDLSMYTTINIQHTTSASTPEGTTFGVKTGTKGDKGERGPKGDLGSFGFPGPGGIKGTKGQTGVKGEIGFSGPKGDVGEKGETGLPGINGTQGQKGQHGDKGAQGEGGADGPKGEKGANGTRGAVGPIGPVGLSGIQGPPGRNGTEGDIGPKGEKGEANATKGDTGPKGEKGEKGEKANTTDIQAKLEKMQQTIDEIRKNHLRLANGGTNFGRVEVYHNGQWGTICDDSWDMDDAAVICRMLGFADATAAPRRGTYGSGTGPIWLDEVECAGAERDIEHCSKNEWGSNDCDHSEDTGVDCA